jgi:hypothetical protein
MLTMCPDPRALISGRNALVIRNTPRTLTFIVSSNCAAVISWTGTKWASPALFTRTSGVPNSAFTSLANPATADSLATSQGRPIAVTPWVRSSPTSASTLLAVREQMASLAPRFPKASAMARPMPSVAPVTTQMEFWRFMGEY